MGEATSNGHATRTAADEGRASSEILGIPIELGEPAEMLRQITRWDDERPPRRVMYVNAHVVNQSREIPELEQALSRAGLIYCDGYGVRLAARTLNQPVPHRMTGADWVYGLAALCEAGGRSLYLLGSEPTTARDAAEKLRRWYPGLDVVGAHHGFFELESPHNDRVIEDINSKQPDIVLVGMGTPKQELWVDRYADRLDVDVLWTVGALFDYIAGRVPRAPRWLADNGLEWIFRLAIEPRRMWKRYLLGNPAFLARVMHEAGHRQAAS
jgi:N-acetylglucosaminyldiphosphoundecaprenol N-acetyl-beta-D-mannosaminyltransferase